MEKSISKNAVLNAIKVLMSMLFPLISFPYASRVLGPSGVGKVDFSTSVVSYFILIASLGIGTYGIRQGAKVRDDKEKLSTFVQEIFIINLITTILAYVVFGISIIKLVQLRPYFDVLMVSGLSIGFTTLGIEWLYGALEDYSYITIRSVIFQAIAIALLFILVRNKEDYIEYAFVQVFAIVGSNILNLIHARKFISWKKTQTYNFKRHMKPIITIFGLNLACNVYMNLDKTMLGLICNDAEVGLYTAALKLNRVILQLILSIGTVVVARLSFYYGKGLLDKFRELFLRVFNYVLMLAIPATLGMNLLSGDTLMLISGEEYLSADLTAKILSLIILIIGMSNLMSVQVFIPMEKEKYSLYASSVAAIVNFTLNLVLIRLIGKEGAAISTVIAEFIALLICIFFSRKLVSYKGVIKNALQYTAAALIIIPIYMISHEICENYIYELISTVFFSALFYGVILLCFHNKYFLEAWKILNNFWVKIKERK